MFKVGDKVRISETYAGYDPVENAVGVILRGGDLFDWVLKVDVPGFEHSEIAVDSHEIELVIE